MHILKTYKFKLYKSHKTRQLDEQLFIASQIHNHFIGLYKRYYRRYKRHPHKFMMFRHLSKLRKNIERWDELPFNTSRNVITRIDRAYAKFFRDFKKGIQCLPPSFKSYRKYKSFTSESNNGYRLFPDNRIRIGSKIFKFHKSREIEGKVKIVTVKRDSLGQWYIFLACEVEIQPEQSSTGNIGAFDFGLKTFLTSHTGEEIYSPLYLKQSLAKLKKANRSLSSKKKGSNNRRRARLNVARVYRHVANQRLDFSFKLARELASKYDALIFEDLTLKGMQALWGRKVNDLGFYQFVRALKHICNQTDKKVILIDRFEPTSKTCSDCKSVVKELPLSVREWDCAVCGSHHLRDHNAAKNILRVGLATLGLGDISPVRPAVAV